MNRLAIGIQDDSFTGAHNVIEPTAAEEIHAQVSDERNRTLSLWHIKARILFYCACPCYVLTTRVYHLSPCLSVDNIAWCCSYCTYMCYSHSICCAINLFQYVLKPSYCLSPGNIS